MKFNTSKLIQLIFMFALIASFNISNGQQLSKINEDIGGGSNSNSSSVSSSDDYILYIVGALAVGGVIAYALLKDKKEEPKKDTTSAILNDDFLEQNLSFNEKISNLQSQIPINVSFGIQGNRAIKDEKRYFVGLNYNF